MADFIRIEIDDRRVKAALARMHARLRDLRPFMKIAGEILVQGTQERFNTMRDPEGRPWKALSPAYQRVKERNKDRILVLYGHLEAGIHYQLEGSRTVHVGSNLIYAAIHQFGGVIRPKSKKALFFPGAKHPVGAVRIPARPYLGMSGRDRARILRHAKEYMAKAVAR